jgi:hypothetical protein
VRPYAINDLRGLLLGMAPSIRAIVPAFCPGRLVQAINTARGHGVPYCTASAKTRGDNRPMLTLRALGTSGSQVLGRVIRSEPDRYEVIGLPTGRAAMLARLSGVWKILRIEHGKYHAWNGSFVSAEDALASIDGHKAQRRRAV